jgi:K+-dependent Na+/Ca+ exchanger-like protein
MAAGGSMPELFTSLIATFKDSEVGFAAIVGSAVFNVLFVIAVCAIASKETLTLTWWPLARDCSFYVMALLTVVAVFADNTVHYYEAIALLLEYCGYCTFMRFNGKVSKWAEEKLNAMKGNARKVTPEGEAGAQASAETSEDAPKETQLNKPSMFRVGIVSLLTQNAYIYETAGIAAITEIEGDLDETFKKIDKDQDGFLSVAEMQELLKKMGCNPDSATLRAAMKRITKSGNELISYAAFKSWYIASEARIQSEVNRIFDKFDANKNGFLEPSEIKKVLKDLGHKSTEDDDCKKIIEEIIKVSEESSDPSSSTAEDPNEVQDLKNDKVNPLSEDKTSPAPPEDGTNKDKAKAITSPRDSPRDSEGLHISLQQFEKWYEKSFFYSQKMKEQELQKEAEEGGLDLEMPPKPVPTGEDDDAKNLRLWYSAMFWYIFTYPLVCVMYCTIPDVRTPKYKRNWRIAVLAFVCSLFWIGLFSNWLYECIVVVSATLKIPPAVAAVTVLAAGTSIPDLISSYVVARKNEADMAVSSSIGSNIFDVTVGLPLPWLLYTIVKWKPFDAIESKTLAVDILVLVAMIASVIGTVMCMKWQMTKMMGYIMLFLYLVFLVQNLLGQLPEGNPTIDYTQFR